MSLTHYQTPKIKIEIDPTGNEDEVQNYMISGSITMRENAVNIAELILADENNEIFEGLIIPGDDVAIYINYAEEGALGIADLKFYGFVEDLTPSLTSEGEVLHVRLRHYGRCVLDMVCAQEYGSESINPTLDELHEILDDNAVGIIDNYVNEILNDGNPSGYNLLDTLIEPDTDSIKYMYFPFKPVKNCLDDLLDVFQTFKTHATAGWHWIIKTVENPVNTFTNYFCLAQVGDHKLGPPNVREQWPNWFNTDAADSTIVVKQDMITQNFMKRRALANYILYYGRLRKPGDGDFFTENQSGLWTDGAQCTSSDENGAGNFIINSFSLKMDFDIGGAPQCYMQTPNAWAIDDWGGKYVHPTVSFWIKCSVLPAVSWQFFLATTNLGNAWKRNFDTLITNTTQWYHIIWKIGPYAPKDDVAADYGWWDTGAADWGNINRVYFVTGGGGQNVDILVDGLEFGGYVARAAKKTGEPYYKQRVIVDNVGKDDSGLAADDSYLMAQLAYAELLRSARTPIQGGIAIPGKPQIMAGQKAHIHAAQYSLGYRLNMDMRITEHRLFFSQTGLLSYLSLTNDLINGYPMPMNTVYNLILSAANPDFQNRQVASIKTREVDVTQNVLEHGYAFPTTY